MIKFNKILQIIFLSACVTSADSLAQSPILKTTEEKTKTNIKSEIKEGFQNTINKIFSKKEDGQEIIITKKRIPNNHSLMYDKEELKKIKSAVEAFNNKIPLVEEEVEEVIKTDSPTKDNSKSYIYLGSILYQSPKQWSIWINDNKISPQNNSTTNEIYVKSINQDKAEIVWTMSISKWKILTDSQSEEDAPINNNNQVEFKFILRFNQSYILNEDKVVEGRVVGSSSKGSFLSPANHLNSLFNK